MQLKQLKHKVGSERGTAFGFSKEMKQEEIVSKIETLSAKETDLKDELQYLNKTVTLINHQDIYQMFDKLGFEGFPDRPGYNMDQEIDRMIFECDSSMNNAITLKEVKECYYRSINDDTGLEPFELFNLIQFLMYDEDLGGSCSVDEVVSLMVNRYGDNDTEKHVKEMFANDDGDGEVSYAEYLSTVEKRPSLDFLRAKGEELAASKCIHIDWQTDHGRNEAKRRAEVRKKRIKIELDNKKKREKKKKKFTEERKT